jgi:hypothetical protein
VDDVLRSAIAVPEMAVDGVEVPFVVDALEELPRTFSPTTRATTTIAMTRAIRRMRLISIVVCGPLLPLPFPWTQHYCTIRGMMDDCKQNAPLAGLWSCAGVGTAAEPAA